jgi:acyl dehydratase
MGTSSPGNRLMFQYLENNPGGRVIHPETGIEDYIGSAHFTDYYAKQSGLPRGYDVGAMRTAWLIHLLTDWMGDSGFITEFSMKLRRPNLIGDTTWLTGTVTGRRMEGESALVDCEVVATNQRDEVTANARATIRLPLAGR